VPAVRRLLGGGAVVLDVQPVPDVAAGPVPGAVAIPLRALSPVRLTAWLTVVSEPR